MKMFPIKPGWEGGEGGGWPDVLVKVVTVCVWSDDGGGEVDIREQ